ncbi:DUF664 domain-containing protein [Streptomyces sp. NEAU-W12]|uniref:mycothiol transferase n=1 Tax=Streptomyces sp. NEAU-W12 TaxID=2994668 RepID=UPI00224AC302|nr:DUF664 domain-containing protein [Streptomyces sp. NEAU-W12]MCX2925089.1 DUF664 domain-containing protein [Streptomyces sp. NEAU-W12]
MVSAIETAAPAGRADGEGVVTTDAVRRLLRRAVQHCLPGPDEAVESLDGDAAGNAFTFFDGVTVSLRRALVHMLEEVARHARRAGMPRESVDGFTGDHHSTSVITAPPTAPRVHRSSPPRSPTRGRPASLPKDTA